MTRRGNHATPFRTVDGTCIAIDYMTTVKNRLCVFTIREGPVQRVYVIDLGIGIELGKLSERAFARYLADNRHRASLLRTFENVRSA